MKKIKIKPDFDDLYVTFSSRPLKISTSLLTPGKHLKTHLLLFKC